MNNITSLHSGSKAWLLLPALLLCIVSSVPTLTYAAEPVPALPQVYVDTTWSPPTGGTTWAAHTSADLTADLTAAQPGDIIVLDAGTTYTGNFTFPAKTNPSHEWIYIESSALSNLPAPGVRIDPINTPDMPKIVTPNSSPAITLALGANYYRLVGAEITSLSNQGCNPSNNPPVNCFSYYLIWGTTTDDGQQDDLADHIIIDRDYLHGSPTQDVIHAIGADGTYFAVVDSYISDIHGSTNDSQAILAYYTPGPIKIVDNYLSATTENVLFGGAGGYNDPYVPSDIEIRNNWFFKPLAWEKCGAQGTVPSGEQLADGSTCPAGVSNQWDEKNSLEFKSAQRVIVTGNIMQNTWLSGQTGTSVLFTIRTSQSGNIAVVDDITFENNVLTNVDAGFSTLEQDDQCLPSDGYPQCTNPGESKRVKIYSNLILLRPSLDTYQHGGIRFDGGSATDTGLTDYVFQHNTVLMSDQSTLWEAVGYSLPQNPGWPGGGCAPPLGFSATHNVWVLDNALDQQPDGDCGLVSVEGVTGLGYYMGDPSPLPPRFYGSVIFAPAPEHPNSYPSNNDVTTTPFTFDSQWLLLTPDWSTQTSDGMQAGIINPGTADVSFTFTPTTPSINQAVQFTDTTTGSPTGWAWDFGDNSTSNLQNPSHTYTTAGTYTVILTVLNANGESQATHNVTVPGASNTTSFTFSPTSPAMGQAVQFTDTSTGNLSGWLWNFGDTGSSDNTSTLQNPTHTYAASGTYTVTLTAGTGSVGGGNQASQKITVSSGSSGATKKGGGAFDWFSLMLLLGFCVVFKLQRRDG